MFRAGIDRADERAGRSRARRARPAFPSSARKSSSAATSTTSAQLHVDGRIDGHVRCAQLCQGTTGIIAGDIVADEARIAGLVEGTVNAAHRDDRGERADHRRRHL